MKINLIKFDLNLDQNIRNTRRRHHHAENSRPNQPMAVSAIGGGHRHRLMATMAEPAIVGPLLQVYLLNCIDFRAVDIWPFPIVAEQYQNAMDLLAVHTYYWLMRPDC